MTSKVQVSCEEVEALQARINEINGIAFADVEWLRNGHPLTVTPQIAEEWRMIGLSNMCFVELYLAVGDAIGGDP